MAKYGEKKLILRDFNRNFIAELIDTKLHPSID
jgi:hypothetical protein